jgi:hypothetical protein
MDTRKEDDEKAMINWARKMMEKKDEKKTTTTEETSRVSSNNGVGGGGGGGGEGSENAHASTSASAAAHNNTKSQQQIKTAQMSIALIVGALLILFLLALIYMAMCKQGGTDDDISALQTRQESAGGIEDVGPQSVLFQPFTAVTQDETALVNATLLPRIGSELPLAPTYDPQAQSQVLAT